MSQSKQIPLSYGKSKSNSRESSDMEEADLSEYDEEVEKKGDLKSKSRRTSAWSRNQSTVSKRHNLKR